MFSPISRPALGRPMIRAGLKRLLADAGDVGLYIIDVGVAEPRNFSLGRCAKSAPEVLAKNGQVQIETDAIRIGPEEERGVAIYELDAQGQAANPRPKDASLEAGRAAERSISRSPRSKSARIRATSAF